MTSNKQKFAEVYAQAFVDSYRQLPAERSKDLIEKAVNAATANIRAVIIDSPAFRLTAKRLGIKCSHKSIEEFLSA